MHFWLRIFQPGILLQYQIVLYSRWLQMTIQKLKMDLFKASSIFAKCVIKEMGEFGWILRLSLLISVYRSSSLVRPTTVSMPTSTRVQGGSPVIYGPLLGQPRGCVVDTVLIAYSLNTQKIYICAGLFHTDHTEIFQQCLPVVLTIIEALCIAHWKFADR